MLALSISSVALAWHTAMSNAPIWVTSTITLNYFEGFLFFELATSFRLCGLHGTVAANPQELAMDTGSSGANIAWQFVWLLLHRRLGSHCLLGLGWTVAAICKDVETPTPTPGRPFEDCRRRVQRHAHIPPLHVPPSLPSSHQPNPPTYYPSANPPTCCLPLPLLAFAGSLRIACEAMGLGLEIRTLS